MDGFYEGVTEQLILWTRQLAWLNTAPETRKVTDKTQTRRERMDADGQPIPMPDNPARYLSAWLLEIGPSVAAGMGEGPIGWSDLTAWERLTGVELSPWEARTLRRMSQAFVAERHDAKKPECPPPWRGDDAEVMAQRDVVSAKIKAAFGVMLRNRG